MSVTYIQRTDAELWQGDILKETVFHYFPPAINIIREKDDYLETFVIEDVPDAFENPEMIMTKAERGKVMIISHSCDVQNKDIIQIAPIRSLTELKNCDRPNCRNNKMHNYCYLPANNSFGVEESFVNFQLMISYPRELLNISKRIASLSAESIVFFHERLLFYFTRKILKEITPELPLVRT